MLADKKLPITWGLAIAGLDVVSFGCSSISASVSADEQKSAFCIYPHLRFSIGFSSGLDAIKSPAIAKPCSIDTFIMVLQNDKTFDNAFVYFNTPDAARRFVEFTFEVVNSNQTHIQSAVFTFEREDLIPNMFLSVVTDLNRTNPDSISIFKYYLDRHIEVDGDHHSHLALQMTANLCGNNEQKWKEAEEAVMAALQMRIALWNGVYKEIRSRKMSESLT